MGDDATNETTTDPTTEIPDTSALVSTRVTFNITIPAVVSDALQVRLVWGEKDITANWVADESWAVSDDFPTNTENPLVVTFNDDNGAITLGSFETDFRTGTTSSESFRITADQFNTNQWDKDGDGVSNFSELVAGTNPQGDDAPASVQASLELVPDKTFRISWQLSTNALFYRVLENADGLSGYTPISEDLDSSSHTFDHRVILYDRVRARYIVQACNASACVDSDELVVSGTLDRAVGYFKASNPDAFDNLGEAVTLSANGNTLAFGSYLENSAATGFNGNQYDDYAPWADAVYLY